MERDKNLIYEEQLFIHDSIYPIWAAGYDSVSGNGTKCWWHGAGP